jgi:hypothetical protein
MDSGIYPAPLTFVNKSNLEGKKEVITQIKIILKNMLFYHKHPRAYMKFVLNGFNIAVSNLSGSPKKNLGVGIIFFFKFLMGHLNE